jgi:acyl-CoA thioesterase-1
MVALGASNTAGYGVGSGEAWPARLEALLHAKGDNVSVANAGISGDATSGTLRRVDFCSARGTNLVLLAITKRRPGPFIFRANLSVRGLRPSFGGRRD